MGGGRRTLTIGLVLTITLVGFEALAVSTALPDITHELHGLGLYGWVFTSYMLGTLLGSVLAGTGADKHGPAWPSRARYLGVLRRFACCGIGAGNVVPRTAGSCKVSAVVRFPRRHTWWSAACTRRNSGRWVSRHVDGVGRARDRRGLALSALVTRTLGWRWVFLLLVPLAVLAGVATVIAMRTIAPPARTVAAAQHAARACARLATRRSRWWSARRPCSSALRVWCSWWRSRSS